ncbi:MAG TPA: type IV-A pilus assembly ATPase PilB [Candidatus Fermentibacter daniensis]|jgi:type IV pilus assembly protein PilB|nr:type IV-A pilus assembly ATPase PilB [Candidatus Fermentibacter daniensis]HOD19143.1 type IV-A pilus assembly ATPase PilB [Candidatus Fermentibacter daniensis]HOG55170.1 type IV-A pilus assembly ATPase PilB [Candidatus Fermentibacter daniensis]HOZ18032.1 type IV-A pilus assembly ATPase PilB [Candidatus Fermentibacter daniensis]HPH39585.1 type IV-A pilus assembly ATPase PilB [Candidatus Fermentibacter daniensis]
MLLQAGLITREQLELALKQQRAEGGRLGYNLVKLKAISEADLNENLAKQHRVESINLDEMAIDGEIVRLVPPEVAKRYEVVPISREGKVLVVAMADPDNLFAIDDLRFSIGLEIEPHICATSMILRAIRRYYPETEALVSLDQKSIVEKYDEPGDDIPSENILVGDEVFESMITEEEDTAIEEDDISSLVADSPVVKLVNSIISDAVKRGASDIHFEPFERYIRIRFRIDGVLHEVMRPSRKYRSAIVSRLKILGGMNIAERHLPQDGRQKIRVGDRFVDMRLATLPTLFGEKVEVRLLDRSKVILDLEKLGMEEESLKELRRAIRRPYGIVLVTGPTGCGKTTTLYSALTELNDVGVNIMTAENPVEFNLKGINQVQMNEDIGLTFASALRAYLRQDPDIIMVGEIRDQETSQIAIRAALTGHLVLSTTHTNDAPSTVNRLIDMGTEPFMLSTSLVAICSQRLIRRVCPRCKAQIHVPEEALVEAGIDPARFANFTFEEGTGCDYCNNTGYRGREGIFEVMPVTEEIRQLIESDANSIQIEKAALAAGMVNLREAALRKLERGLTTFEEVVRSTIGGD